MLTTTKTMIETKIFVSSFMPKQCVAWNLKFASPNISLVRTIKFESGDSAQKPAGSSYITMQASTIRDLDGLALLAGWRRRPVDH